MGNNQQQYSNYTDEAMGNMDPHLYYQQLYSQSPPLYQNMTMEQHQQTLATNLEYA